MGTVRITQATLDESLKETEDKKFEPVAAGEYLMQIISVEEKESKSGGIYLKFEYAISDTSSPYYKRKIWDNVNIVNANPVAVSIGLKKLAQIGRCCNITNLTEFNTQDFVGNIMYVTLTIEDAKEYGMQNRVKSVRVDSNSDQIPF